MQTYSLWVAQGDTKAAVTDQGSCGLSLQGHPSSELRNSHIASSWLTQALLHVALDSEMTYLGWEVVLWSGAPTH